MHRCINNKQACLFYKIYFYKNIETRVLNKLLHCSSMKKVDERASLNLIGKFNLVNYNGNILFLFHGIDKIYNITAAFKQSSLDVI